MRYPFRNYDVGLVDPSCAVRVHELSGLELVFCFSSQVSRVAIPQLGDGFVVNSEDGDPAFEVRDQHEAAIEVDVAGHSHALGNEAFVLAVEVEHLEAAVSSVGDDDLGLARGALVYPQTMGATDLSCTVSGSDDGADEGAVLGVFVDEATTVSITDENVSRGEERDVCGVPAVSVSILAGLLWVVQFPDDSTIQVGFGNHLSVDIADVKELFPSLFTEVKAVGAAGPFGAE